MDEGALEECEKSFILRKKLCRNIQHGCRFLWNDWL